MERTNEYAYKGVVVGVLYKIVSSSVRSSTNIVRVFVKRVLRKIENAGETKARQKNRYHDAIHDD